MKSKFGILSKLNFLQNFVSTIISKTNPAVIHNIEKYVTIQKIVFLNSSERQEGDYLEFGVYTGSSFCHAIRCFKECETFNPKQNLTNFFGFDSFEGFGELNENDKHPFYIDQNFQTKYNDVKKRVAKAISNWSKAVLIKGFFNDTLSVAPKDYGIKKARIVFIDSDTYSSAKYAFDFIKEIVTPGTHIILDDFYNYRGNPNKGIASAFNEFITNSKYSYRKILDYGVGGIAVVLH